MPSHARQDRGPQVRAWINDGSAKTWRVRAGLTVARAADRLRVSMSTVNRWERGEAFPQGRNADDYWRFLDQLSRREDNR